MKLDPFDEPVSESLFVTTVVSAAEIPPTRQSPGPWSVLRNRNYALLFWGQLISSTGTQMQVVAVA